MYAGESVIRKLTLLRQNTGGWDPEELRVQVPIGGRPSAWGVCNHWYYMETGQVGEQPTENHLLEGVVGVEEVLFFHSWCPFLTTGVIIPSAADVKSVLCPSVLCPD